MASNIALPYPPAPGAATPPSELQAFGNESASTKDSLLNYVTTDLPTTPVSGDIRARGQYIKNRQEYPR